MNCDKGRAAIVDLFFGHFFYLIDIVESNTPLEGKSPDHNF